MTFKSLLCTVGVLMPALASAGQGKPSKIPPAVAVTAPANGSTIVVPSLPTTINVTATVVPPAGDKVVNVKFSAGAMNLGTQTKPVSGNTYSVSWLVTAPGIFTLTADGQDAGGAGAAASATVVVQLSAPPATNLTSPSNNALFVAGASVALRATASAANGTISSVKFYSGASLLGAGVLNAGAYEWTWSSPPAGSYSLKAVATDSFGASGNSATVNIVVDARPVVTLISPAPGPFPAGSTIPLSANASDSDGTVASVVFYADASPIATSASVSSPYGASWAAVPAGSYSLTAVATDNRGISTTSAPVAITVNALAPGNQPLVQPSNLVYQGAFRLPDGVDGVLGPTVYSTFQYGGSALAYNAAHNSLYIVGHDVGQLVAEIGIPPVVNSNVIGNLATATVLQPFRDPTGGQLGTVNPGGQIKIGGLLPYNDRLYVSAYTYYDGLNTQITSHFITDPNLSLTNVNGPYQLGTPGFCLTANLLCAGFVDGYMAMVPPEWQAALGGPVLTGQCCIPVVSRTSWGPSAVTINPADFGVTSPVPIIPQVYYPMAYPTLGVWDASSLYFNGSSEIQGLVFPTGTRSLLFFGRQGTGPFCYGEGTANPALVGLPTGDGSFYCLDPTSVYKGTHAYPYQYYVWAYDAATLAGVAGGYPWEVTPYAVWQLTLPLGTADAHLLGAAYDPATGRIFVSEGGGDANGRPLIHVFSVQVN